MDIATSKESRIASDISPVDALWALIQCQSKSVRKALIKRILSDDQKVEAQKEIVKESLSKAFDEFSRGEVKHNARDLFSL